MRRQDGKILIFHRGEEDGHKLVGGIGVWRGLQTPPVIAIGQVGFITMMAIGDIEGLFPEDLGDPGQSRGIRHRSEFVENIIGVRAAEPLHRLGGEKSDDLAGRIGVEEVNLAKGTGCCLEKGHPVLFRTLKCTLVGVDDLLFPFLEPDAAHKPLNLSGVTRERILEGHGVRVEGRDRIDGQNSRGEHPVKIGPGPGVTVRLRGLRFRSHGKLKPNDIVRVLFIKGLLGLLGNDVVRGGSEISDGAFERFRVYQPVEWDQVGQRSSS